MSDLYHYFLYTVITSKQIIKIVIVIFLFFVVISHYFENYKENKKINFSKRQLYKVFNRNYRPKNKTIRISMCFLIL